MAYERSTFHRLYTVDTKFKKFNSVLILMWLQNGENRPQIAFSSDIMEDKAGRLERVGQAWCETNINLSFAAGHEICRKAIELDLDASQVKEIFDTMIDFNIDFENQHEYIAKHAHKHTW